MQQLKVGSSLQGGKYKIEKVLGQGGFGITYLATQELLDRKVCIKEFFFKEYCERDEATSHVTLGTQSNHELVERFMTKFLKEARTISQLEHPHIIRIHDIFKENNTAYYVMEYIEGESLADRVNHYGALPESEAVEYIKQVASALAFIHQRSINHLDVKPDNIMIRKSDNKAVLIDFGLSKQYDAQGGQTSTTPVGISHGYAPMEQYKQGGVSTFSPQTDIYSLGATLYKLVTGNTPPQASDVLNDGFPELPLALSSKVKNAINQAMQVRKKDRPEDVKAFFDLMKTSTSTVPSEETKIVQPQAKPIEDEATMVLDKPEVKEKVYSFRRVDDKLKPTVSFEPIEIEKGKKNFSNNLKLDFYLGSVCLSIVMILLDTMILPVWWLSQYYLTGFFGLVGLVCLFFLGKQLRLYNKLNMKVQYSIITYLLIALNVITLGLSVFIIINADGYYDWINNSFENSPSFWLNSIGILLIPIGTIQLLLWDKYGFFTGIIGLVVLLIFPGYYILSSQIFFYVLCQALLLSVKKNGVNSWKQLEYGSTFRKHKFLYLILTISIVALFGIFFFVLLSF